MARVEISAATKTAQFIRDASTSYLCSDATRNEALKELESSFEVSLRFHLKSASYGMADAWFLPRFSVF